MIWLTNSFSERKYTLKNTFIDSKGTVVKGDFLGYTVLNERNGKTKVIPVGQWEAMKETCKQINFQQQTFLETSSEIEYA